MQPVLLSSETRQNHTVFRCFPLQPAPHGPANQFVTDEFSGGQKLAEPESRRRIPLRFGPEYITRRQAGYPKLPR